MGTDGGPSRGDFAPTSGSPVAPSRTCRLFPRRDSRSPHLSSLLPFLSPLTLPSLAPLSLSLSTYVYPLFLRLQTILHRISLSLPPPLSLFPFEASSTASPSSSRTLSRLVLLRHTCAPRAPSNTGNGHAYLFLDIFRTDARYTPCYTNLETRCRFWTLPSTVVGETVYVSMVFRGHEGGGTFLWWNTNFDELKAQLSGPGRVLVWCSGLRGVFISMRGIKTGMGGRGGNCEIGLLVILVLIYFGWVDCCCCLFRKVWWSGMLGRDMQKYTKWRRSVRLMK